MKRTLTISDHLGFQWTVLRTTLAGGLLGLLHAAFGNSSGYLAEISGLRGSWAWLYGATAVALLGSAALPPRGRREQAWVLACAVLAGAASGYGAQQAWTHECWAMAGTAGVALALSLYLARGVGVLRGLGMLALGSLAALVAQRLPAALGAQDAFLELPRSLASLLSGLGVGFVVGGSTVVRHLQVVRTAQPDKELRALLPPADAKDEIASLVLQAVSSYQQATEALEEHPQAKVAASELVKKIARFGKKWQDIESQTKKSERSDLEKRVAELSARRDGSTDEGVRGEYERALSALREQLTYLDEIEKGRQRAIARLHHQVATLDRLRLAAVRHRSVGAAKLGEELKTVVDELNEAGQDLDTAAELAELPG
jgi:hypothetical protein